MKSRILLFAALMTMLGSPLLAEMRMLRPLPNTLESKDRMELESMHAKAVAQGRTLCNAYSRFRTQCDGKADSTACRASFSDINEKLGHYNEEAEKYNGAVVAKLRQRVEGLAKVVQRDQQAIRSLGIHHDSEEFESWSKWLEDADAERMEQVDAAFRDAAMSAASSRIKAALRAGALKTAALDPKTAERLIGRLKGAGVGDPYFFEAIRKVASTGGKQETAEAGMKVLDRLGKAKSIWDLHDMGPNKESATWKAGSELLGLFIPDPELELVGKLTLDEVRATFYTVNEAAIDVPVLSARVRQLGTLTEMHLLALRTLSARLQADVQKKAPAAKELAGIDKRKPEEVCAMGPDPSEPVAAEFDGVLLAQGCRLAHAPGQ